MLTKLVFPYKKIVNVGSISTATKLINGVIGINRKYPSLWLIN